MQRAELPRNDSGAVIGQWKLVHRLPDFTVMTGVVNFRDGSTTRPLSGRVLERAMAAFGDAVSAEPWPEDPAPAAAPEPAQEPTPMATVTGPAVHSPTTRAELNAMSEKAMRDLVSEIGEEEGAHNWNVKRIRRFLADELNLGDA